MRRWTAFSPSAKSSKFPRKPRFLRGLRREMSKNEALFIFCLNFFSQCSLLVRVPLKGKPPATGEGRRFLRNFNRPEGFAKAFAAVAAQLGFLFR